jgi:hypothetical protein
MSLRAISRAALGGSIRLARLPIDGTLGLAGDNPTAASAKLAVDRLEATVRTAVGTVLADEEIKREARRRRQATDERERAMDLRVAAEARSRTAESRAAELRREAARRRRGAEQEAQSKLRKADKRRAAAKSKATKVSQSRRAAAEKEAARKESEIEEQAKRARLDQLEEKSEALEEKDTALTAADEAQRLREAATAAKADRKASS